jgi:hypothetical protein
MYNYWVETDEYFAHINLKKQFSDIDYFAVLPLIDDINYKFICFFKSLSYQENKKINLKIIKNDVQIFEKNYDITNDFAFYEIFQLKEYLPHVLDNRYTEKNDIIIYYSISIDKEIKEEKNIVLNNYKDLKKNGVFILKEIIGLEYLEEKIYVSFNCNLFNSIVIINDLNNNCLYAAQEQSYNKHEKWWFVPDNKIYKDGFNVVILKNGEIFLKKEMLLK